jgi:spore germination protein KB
MRLEIIIVINFLMMGFLKITALHYSTVLGLGQIFKLRSIRPLIVPIGILMVIFSIINYSGFIENVEFTYQVYHIYALPFQLGMPLLTLIVAVIRKLPQRSTE